MSNLKISIAMATYNGERFLREQLDSFARQERLPDELVVTDDASTDRTIEVVREFAAGAPFPVRIFVNEKRLGINGNFGRAVEESSGDIIFFSDSDDYWYPQKIRVMEKAFEETPEAGVVICKSVRVDEHLQPIARNRRRQFGRFFSSPRLLRDLARGKTYVANLPAQGCCLAFRARFKDLVLPFPETSRSRPFSYDRFTAQVTLSSGAGGALFLTEPLQLYRQHTGQATHGIRELRFRRALRRVSTRHEVPYKMPFLLHRIESECAARHCVNHAIRRGAMRHWHARVNLPASFADRLPVVAREFLSFRYHRFSGDTLSAAKDLFLPREPGSEAARLTGACHGPATNP